VASSQPLAVQVGIDILKKGGCAVDAAIAVNAALGLIEPMSCGLGGDLFAIVWDAEAKKLLGLNGSGRSPHALTREVFAEKGRDRIPLRGPLSWSVPGCVSGWFTLHDRFGRLPMADLLAPAIDYAEAGFPLSPVIASMWQKTEGLLSSDPGAAATYLPNGRAPACGEVFRNPDLARVLRLIAEGEKEAFYRGEIAQEIAAASQELGGSHSKTSPITLLLGWNLFLFPIAVSTCGSFRRIHKGSPCPRCSASSRASIWRSPATTARKRSIS
jgi:gamma-glutamyltranspeptidase/glutathione hydrolase